MPQVTKAVKKVFPEARVVLKNPELAISFGAAKYAQTLNVVKKEEKQPAFALRSMKRRLHEKTIRLADKDFTPKEILTKMFAFILDSAEKRLESEFPDVEYEVMEVALAMPVDFTAPRIYLIINALKDVVLKSGKKFCVEGVIQEPSAAGKNLLGQCNTSEWKNIVHIDACGDYSVSVDADGRVHICGDTDDYGLKEAESWRNILGVAAGLRHLLGLRTDGTVEAVGDNQDHQCDVGGWKDIVRIKAEIYRSLGLTKEGKWLSTKE